MKRNEKMVPAFDDIVFRCRNKNYGAYDLRKRYKSTTGISILSVSGAAILFIIIVASLMPKEVQGGKPGIIDVVLNTSNLPKPEQYKEPEVPKPPEGVKLPAYTPPVIVDDTVTITGPGLIGADVINSANRDGNVDDTIHTYTDIGIIDDDLRPKNDEPLVVPQEQPEFPGGPEALNKFIKDNLKYPQEAADVNVQGKVIVKFAVNADGSVNRIEVLRSVNSLLDQEAMRVVSIFPKWRPGKQNGTPVAVWFVLPVTFRLSN
jgi:periplasmic protein TonB